MRKNSKRAQRIHTLVHQMMHAIETDNQRALSRAYSEAYCIDRHERTNGRRGYPLTWFVEIARQYPAALDARPDLARWINDFETNRRAEIRGKRDFTTGYGREDNPYCAYTNQIAYDAWDEGWMTALRNVDYTEEELDIEAAQAFEEVLLNGF